MSSYSSLASPSNTRNTNGTTISKNVSPNSAVSSASTTNTDSSNSTLADTTTTRRPPRTGNPIVFDEFSAEDRE